MPDCCVRLVNQPKRQSPRGVNLTGFFEGGSALMDGPLLLLPEHPAFIRPEHRSTLKLDAQGFFVQPV